MFHHLPHTHAGANGVISSLHIDHQQMAETWNRMLMFAIKTSPVKQFGLGFGVGWYACMYMYVF